MKTQRKDHGGTTKTRSRFNEPDIRMKGGYGEDEDYDPREADLDEDDESSYRNRDTDYDSRHRSKP